ncbi:MAG TPA: ABC transporter transmembrane domain-containing protein, partial [Terriglobales bacterium]|nr:ABC transporter transmembrane domain-containing protein [Terriglobales bacterium]
MKTLSSLKPYFWRYRWGFVFGTVTLLIQNLTYAYVPQVLRQASNDINLGVTRHKLVVYTSELLVLSAIRAIFLFLTRWKVIGISREIEFDLRNDLFRHLEGLSYPYYQRTRTGDIMARATNDLNAVRMLLGPAIMYSANTIVFTAAALVFMWHISPRLTLYTFLPLPVASIVIQYFGRKIHERFERI